MLSEGFVWFALARHKHGGLMLAGFLLFVVIAVLVWNLLP